MIEPTVGRIVLYCMSEVDAQQINRLRTNGASISMRMSRGNWPEGAQAHIGNEVKAGDVLPATIVKVNGPDSINAKVFLDGSDDYWKTSISVSEGPEPGRFHWMAYQIGQAKKHES